MKVRTLVTAATLVSGLCFGSAGTQAQGVVRGANDGQAAGERVGGPIGGVVGSVIGGVVGGVNGAVDGVLGRDARPRFRAYVTTERRPSYDFGDDLRVGTVLPGSGVTYYEAPEDYGLRTYRYTVVNGRTVLVDPLTHRVVEIID